MTILDAQGDIIKLHGIMLKTKQYLAMMYIHTQAKTINFAKITENN
jgi:hypothetical protein